MQKGYKLKSKLLRPALVIVSKKKSINPWFFTMCPHIYLN
jgi:hypothetical protein